MLGRTREEHDRNLAWVLSKCKEFNVKIKLEKCQFAKYLGFRVSGKYIKPLADKVNTLKREELPKDKNELRRLMGRLNFYSRFIPNYSKLLELMRSLLLKDSEFK